MPSVVPPELVDDWLVAHASGRFDRTPEALVEQFFNLASSGAVRIAFTEISSKDRRAALEHACAKAGWALVYHGGDTGIAYDLSVFRVVESLGEVVAELPYKGPHGRPRAPFTAVMVLVESLATGLTYLDSAGHTPAHVATAKGWRGRTMKVLAHWRGCRAWWAAIKAKTKIWAPTGGRIASADFNINLALTFARVYLRATFPALRLVKDGRWAHTHDRRTIDGILVGRALRRRGRIRVRRTRASDHLEVLVRLVRRPRRRNPKEHR